MKTWRWATKPCFSAEHKLWLTGYQLTEQFCNSLQNLLKAHGWQSDEHTWHQIYRPLHFPPSSVSSNHLSLPPNTQISPPAIKGDAPRSRVQRIDWDSLVSGGCTALPEFHCPTSSAITTPAPFIYLSDPTLPVTYHSPALLWHENHTRAALCLNAAILTHAHTIMNIYSLQLLPSVWLFVFGFILLLCFTATSTLPPLLCQSCPANASCPDNRVILSSPPPILLFMLALEGKKEQWAL